MVASKYKRVTVLIAEDDPAHARLIEMNLSRAGFDNPVFRVENGEEALDFLRCRGAYAGHERPSPLLVLLDLEMPVMDGYEVLERMRADPDLQRIPVVVLTSRDEPEEIERCYKLGCNVYITKPLEYESFAVAIHELGLFMSICAIPDTA